MEFRKYITVQNAGDKKKLSKQKSWWHIGVVAGHQISLLDYPEEVIQIIDEPLREDTPFMGE